MMLLSGWLQYRPEDRDEVVAGLKEVTRRSREDPGCVDYWWAEDLEQANTFHFFECWESAELFEAHRTQPYEEEFNERFVNGRITAVEAWGYTVSDRRSALDA